MFVDSFLQHTRHYESPTSFWRWAAYTTIAAVVRDNVYRRMGDNRLYPNIYTLLLAESAVHRKGAPVRLCEELVKQTKSTKLIAGRSSIQGILDELARGETDKQTGKLIAGGSALFSAPELSAGIVNDPEAIKILTDIYDFKENFTSRLRGSGTFHIKNLCFTMMAASNEELLRDVYDTKALYGGLLGRTFLVKPDEFRDGNSLFTIQDTSESFANLLQILRTIANLKGEFHFTNPAEKAYDEWYLPFRKSYEKKSDKSGIIGRIHTSVLKVAMVIAIDCTQKLIVDRVHIEEAINQCVRLIPNYSSFVMATGKSTVADIASILIENIWNQPKRSLTRQEFLSRHFHQFDLEVFEKCVETLQAAGLLSSSLNGSGEFSYMITEKCIKTFDLKEDTK